MPAFFFMLSFYRGSAMAWCVQFGPVLTDDGAAFPWMPCRHSPPTVAEEFRNGFTWCGGGGTRLSLRFGNNFARCGGTWHTLAGVCLLPPRAKWLCRVWRRPTTLHQGIIDCQCASPTLAVTDTPHVHMHASVPLVSGLSTNFR